MSVNCKSLTLNLIWVQYLPSSCLSKYVTLIIWVQCLPGAGLSDMTLTLRQLGAVFMFVMCRSLRLPLDTQLDAEGWMMNWMGQVFLPVIFSAVYLRRLTSWAVYKKKDFERDLPSSDWSDLYHVTFCFVFLSLSPDTCGSLSDFQSQSRDLLTMSRMPRAALLVQVRPFSVDNLKW